MKKKKTQNRIRELIGGPLCGLTLPFGTDRPVKILRLPFEEPSGHTRAVGYVLCEYCDDYHFNPFVT
jgi:hypothetical protein